LDHRAADELIFDEPCLLFALPRERQSFLGDFPAQQRIADAPCWAAYCGPAWLNVLVLTTGMGQANVERALAWLDRSPKLSGVPCKPRLLLSCGFAGGLVDELKVGDVVVATEVWDENGVGLSAPWPGVLNGVWNPFPHRGRIVTVQNAVGTVLAKAELGQKHAALAVDMESSIVAGWCQRRGIPFGSIRVISDDSRTSFSPAMQRLLQAGDPSIWRFLSAGLRSPNLLAEMLRLARQTRLAGRQLGKALGELLTLTLPFGAEL
jgi:adenosylhomocysteine nucleosidase